MLIQICSTLHAEHSISKPSVDSSTTCYNDDGQTRFEKLLLAGSNPAPTDVWISYIVMADLADDEDAMDQMLIRQLIVDQPFAAAFGKNGQAWKTCAERLSQAQDPDGNLVYGSHGVSDKGIKKRFDDLMAFVKGNDASIPFQSGCDDQPGPNNLVSALEDLYEVYTSFLSETKLANAASAATKVDDAMKAEALRNASLGCLTRKDMEDIKSAQQNRKKKQKTSRPTSSSSSSKSGDEVKSSLSEFRLQAVA